MADHISGRSEELDRSHVYHCLDALRKDVLCAADDTPMPTSARPRAIGDGQPLMCRSYDKLVVWAYHKDRRSCHKSLNEYKPFKHPVERYAFCPESSPYYSTMKGFFEKHGHVYPYEDET